MNIYLIDLHSNEAPYFVNSAAEIARLIVAIDMLLISFNLVCYLPILDFLDIFDTLKTLI
jgi:hypothetical protein